MDMIDDKMQERIEQIIQVAERNKMHISYYIVMDILSDKNKDMPVSCLDEFIKEIKERGVSIEGEEEDEDYNAGKQGDNGFIPADVNITPKNMMLGAMIERLENKEIVLNPDYQRNGNLWSREEQSRLIESLMLKIPIPAFYFDGADEGNWIVIDGLQRLCAFQNCIVEDKNPIRLCGLEYLKEFEGFTFKELPRQYKRRIRETSLMVYTIEKGTPDEVVYNIFKRINTGGLILTPQEIRHALYGGKNGSTGRFIKELAEIPEFKFATDYIKKDRLLDCEYITRYIAFTKFDYEEFYRGNIDNYLIMAMKAMNSWTDNQKECLAKELQEIMKYSSQVLGRYVFRRIGKDGRKGPLNKALFEAWCICFCELSPQDRRLLLSKRSVLLSKFCELMDDTSFSSWLKSADKYSVLNRVRLIRKIIKESINVK